MGMKGYSLGIDMSTQSVTATALDMESGGRAGVLSLNFAEDARLNRYGIDRESYLVPPREPGEADQPPRMFMAALDAILADLAKTVDLSKVKVINCSAQQHGHVYLNAGWKAAASALNEAGCGGTPLADRFASVWSYGTAPIWKTSNTKAEADALRAGAGGAEGMMKLSGSDSPLRFSGAAARRTALRYPAAWRETTDLKLLSALLAAVLSGKADAPTDWGNACGMSLMDYSGKSWSPVLAAACVAGVEDGKALLSRLGTLASPVAKVGPVAAYFRERYGLPADAVVLAGSGDNPQTKVLADGDLLSLGTSFVAMVATDGRPAADAAFNSMYDGLGRPFAFGCRTNGALVWDRILLKHGRDRKDYKNNDAVLARIPVGTKLSIWQPETESFPLSRACDISREGSGNDFETDWAGIVDSSLSLVYLYSNALSSGSKEPLSLTGGPSGSAPILERVAAIWGRPVRPLAAAGASAGAACAGIFALTGDCAEYRAALDSCVEPGRTVEPDAAAAAKLRAPGGYFEKLADAFQRFRNA